MSVSRDEMVSISCLLVNTPFSSFFVFFCDHLRVITVKVTDSLISRKTLSCTIILIILIMTNMIIIL